ncbi:unnamed protein product [Mycena citricolor]|uniref:Uncharacterized protein n=1 Tax=Mycena citricolor TaxID=2018698 RepID=A0AAD2HNI1_9AGAR|nr:unnamed protein product [Mycena citricolor]
MIFRRLRALPHTIKYTWAVFELPAKLAQSVGRFIILQLRDFRCPGWGSKACEVHQRRGLVLDLLSLIVGHCDGSPANIHVALLSLRAVGRRAVRGRECIPHSSCTSLEMGFHSQNLCLSHQDIQRLPRLTKIVVSLVIMPQLQSGQVCTNHPAAEKGTLHLLEESRNGTPHKSFDLSLPGKTSFLSFRGETHALMTKTELAKALSVRHLSSDVLQQPFEHDLSLARVHPCVLSELETFYRNIACLFPPVRKLVCLGSLSAEDDSEFVVQLPGSESATRMPWPNFETLFFGGAQFQEEEHRGMLCSLGGGSFPTQPRRSSIRISFLARRHLPPPTDDTSSPTSWRRFACSNSPYMDDALKLLVPPPNSERDADAMPEPRDAVLQRGPTPGVTHFSIDTSTGE